MSTLIAAARTSLTFEDGLTDVGLLGPALLSALMVLISFNFDVRELSAAVLAMLVGLQLLMLALSAAMSVSGACVAAALWTARVAPSRAAASVGRRMGLQLRWSAGLGLAGPLTLAAASAIGTRADPGYAVLLGMAVAAVLMAGHAFGAWSGLAWRGRAPRRLLWGWPVLALVMGLLPWMLTVQPVSVVWAALMIAGGVWARRAFAAQWRRSGTVWSGMPAFRPAGRARALGRSGWQPLPFQGVRLTAAWPQAEPISAGWPRFFSVYLPTVWLPQVILNHKVWVQLAWGGTVTGWGVPAYALWLMALTVVAGTGLFHPGLHWRRQLAPGGLNPRSWAWRMFTISLLGGLTWLTLAVGLMVALNRHHPLSVILSTWPTVAADMALAYALAFWVRAWRNVQWAVLLPGLVVLVSVSGLALALAAAGWPLVRSGLWVSLQWFLAVLLARDAVRRWAGQDLNALSQPG